MASENSVHKLLELLPGKVLNGDKVEVRLATRQNLSQFEAQARKREWGAGTWWAAPWAPPLSCQDETLGWGGKPPAASGVMSNCRRVCLDPDPSLYDPLLGAHSLRRSLVASSSSSPN